MSSHSINELYEFTPDVGSRTSSRLNPLVEDSALNEAEFIDMRLSPQRSRVGIIFDIQWCHFEGANAALAVLAGVGKVAWSNDASRRQRPWYSTRGYWTPTAFESYPPIASDGRVTWAEDAVGPEAPGALTTTPAIKKLSEYVLGFDELSVSGLRAQIYIGHIDGLDGAPPDMTELSDAEIIAGFPRWSSVMEVREHYKYPD
jgi:hypothetical protein